MPFSAQNIIDAGKIGLDYYIKNAPPEDNVAIERPLFKALRERQKSAPGAKQYIVEQIRMSYGGALQWYRGSGVVTYNTRQSIEQAQFPWQSAHDGLTLDEDRLAQNGIAMTDDDDRKGTKSSEDEQIQLTNLIEEQSEILVSGFKEGLSKAVHLDGTQATDSIVGLDALLTMAAAPVGAGTQVVGGIDVFTFPLWRNQVYTGNVLATLIDNMEKGSRLAAANGGGITHYFAGGNFIDLFRNATKQGTEVQRFVTIQPSGGTKMDPGITGLNFKGIPIVYCPEWETNFSGSVAPTISWNNRCYGLNLKHIRLRPLDNQDMVSRKPVRPANQYVAYMALTWKGGMTINNRRSNAVFSV